MDRTMFLGSLFLVWLTLAPTLFAPATEVVLQVTDHGGVARDEWPVCGGVPFGRGELADCGGLELVDDRGVPVALQCEPLARWEDGSIKWLLADFFAGLEPRQTRQYVLRRRDSAAARSHQTGHPVTWQKAGDGVFIDTGVLRARVGPRFLESVSVRNQAGEWIDLVTEPGEMWITVDGDNRGRYLASLDRQPEIAVEQSGPNRVCVRISGWHTAKSGKRFGPYVLRVHAYRGKPFFRVFHTFVNSDLPERGLITGVGLRARFSAGQGAKVNYGGLISTVGTAATGSLAQIGWDRQEVLHERQTLAAGEPLKGYLALETPKGTAAVLVRNWAQLFPKTLAWDGRGLACWFWPEDAGPFDLRREEFKQSPEWLAFKRDYPKLYADWIDPGTAKSAGISARRYRAAMRLGQMGVVAGSSALGLARTHEMLWVFLPADCGAKELDALDAALHEPLLPVVNPMYLDQTEVLGRLGWYDPQSFPQVENYFRRKLDWIIRHQNEWSRWWGVLDWGGLRSLYEIYGSTTIPGQWFKFLGRHGWHNSEVDIPNHVMYHYLRSGDRRVFHFYESILRHQMDVDTIHVNLPDFQRAGHEWEEGQWTRGGQHRHSYDHYSGGPNVGHSWNEGLANYYFLTGDRRAYDVALEVGEYSLGQPVGKVPGAFEKWTTHANEKLRFARSASNAYRIALKCYELTGAERWKEEALRWRSHFLSHSPAYLDQQPATFHVTTYLVRTFALDYHMFRDPQVADELVRIARWHCGHMKRGYDERGLHYPYLACGMAWWFTRDDDLLRWPWHTYLHECQSADAKCRKPNDFRQSHFYELGQLPFFLRACREAGYSESSPPPRPSDMRTGLLQESSEK